MRTPVVTAAIPAELKALPQWITWFTASRDGRPTKLPIDPTRGKLARVNDPDTWASFEEALHDYRTSGGRRAGLGFVFSSDDPYVGVDIDHATDDAGHLSDDAQRLMRELDSYCDRSPSGHGLHIIARAERNFPGTRKGNVELYSQGRFFTMTGRVS
jgi:primase-polymerase (primpol)-like protein